jgi:hypothetical protein
MRNGALSVSEPPRNGVQFIITRRAQQILGAFALLFRIQAEGGIVGAALSADVVAPM